MDWGHVALGAALILAIATKLRTTHRRRFVIVIKRESLDEANSPDQPSDP